MTNRPLPSWELIGPDENGLVFLEWKNSEGSSQGVPLGYVGDVRERMTQWLIETGDDAAA